MIKKIRKQLKMSQKEFGDWLGVTNRTVINWEKGGNIPKVVLMFLELYKKQLHENS